jgi:quinol monooxygenase YgiN
MTIKKTASFIVKEGGRERALEVIRDFVSHAQSEQRTLLYESWQGADRPGEFLHFMEFLDEAAEQAHQSSDAVKKFTGVLYPLCTKTTSFDDWQEVT